MPSSAALKKTEGVSRAADAFSNKTEENWTFQMHTDTLFFYFMLIDITQTPSERFSFHPLAGVHVQRSLQRSLIAENTSAI